MSILQTIKDVVMVPIHPKGKAIIIAVAAVALILWMISGFLGFLGLLALLFSLYFFRDPVRTVPLGEGFVLATGDGVVSHIGDAPLPKELATDDTLYHKVSIFLNVFNVHVNRLPVSGTITREIYIPGKFLNAALDKASDANERSILTITTDTNEVIGFVQIAGFVARRIICSVNEGDRAQQGARYGIIRFGSRCDIYIPKDYQLLISKGSICVGGETIVAIKPGVFDGQTLAWKQD